MYLTYKITNLITGGYYIGSHKTDDPNDDYMGSGRLIKKSIEEYGIENHKKEILGSFETREESLELEHRLIKERKENGDSLILNRSTGGTSFDYINKNLTFDRSAFGKMASHDWSHEERRKNIEEYNKDPKRCKECGAAIPYDRKTTNDFCSSSCAAKYNNRKRANPPKESGKKPYVPPMKKERVELVCPVCGKTFIKRVTSSKKFCCQQCANEYIGRHKPLTEIQQVIYEDLEKIRERHKTESYRKIAKDYGVSGNYIKDILKGRVFEKKVLKGDRKNDR